MQLNYLNKYCLVAIMFLFTDGNNCEIENQCGTSIIDGNCVYATDIERVYYNHVEKNAIPLIIRSEIEKIYVDNTIYCVIAQNQKSSDTGVIAKITAGGVGQKYVFIYLESYRGNGLDFYISIYAKNGTQVKQPLPVPMILV